MDKNTSLPDDFNESTKAGQDRQSTEDASNFFMQNLQKRLERETSMDDLTQQILKKILEQQANPGNPPDQEAWELLAKMQGKARQYSLVDDSVDQLLTKLKDEDWQVRTRAAQMLGQTGDLRAVEPLIQALADPAYAVRYQTAAALGQLKDVRAIEPLIETLMDPDLNTSNTAQNALKQLGTSAVIALITALNHENSYVRWTTASLLGEIRDVRALPALKQTQQNDPTIDPVHGAVRDAAARAIRSINRGKNKSSKSVREIPTSQINNFDWAELMQKFSVALLESNNLIEEPSQEKIDAQWLGYPAATEEQISQAEIRLGTKLPPSYREFLKITNGWGQITNFIYKLWSVEEVEWFKTRNKDWVDVWMNDPIPVADEDYFVYGEEQSTLTIRAEYMQTALEISDTGDSAIFLLNPQVITPEGEWEAWFFANWYPGAVRYRSFWEMMQAEYESFLRLEAS